MGSGGFFRGWMHDVTSSLRELLRLKEPLEMGVFTARDFFLYESQPAPGGSIYRKLARFPVPTQQEIAQRAAE